MKKEKAIKKPNSERPSRAVVSEKKACRIVKGLDGSYLSLAGVRVPDRINLIYTDLPFALSTNFDSTARYTRQLKEAAHVALEEETVLVAVCQIYHSV